MQITRLLILALAVFMPEILLAQDGINLLDDLNLDEGLVEVPEEPGLLVTIGGPAALLLFGIALVGSMRWTIPFKGDVKPTLLYHMPVGIRRGIAMAVTMYGIAFALGASEIAYQLHIHGSAEEYFANMSLGKLIAFSHGHLFGFTTSFLIIGIPFSLQFAHMRYYQIIMPVGLGAALIDVMSWWGIKYVHINFEFVSMVCGILFSLSYLYMLIALIRVILFPHIIIFSDSDAEVRRQKFREAEERRKAELKDQAG